MFSAAGLRRRLDTFVDAVLVGPHHLLEEHEVVLALKQAPQIEDKGSRAMGRPQGLPAAGSLADKLGWLAGLIGTVG